MSPKTFEPRIIFKPAFTVVGLTLNGTHSADDRDALWDLLAERYREIHQVDPDAGYGVHLNSGNHHTYLAGLSAGPGGAIPQGMTAQHFGPHTYAVFTHNGFSSALAGTVDGIFSIWLPDSGFHQAAGYYFEYYDDRFQPNSIDSLLFIFVPVAENKP